MAEAPRNLLPSGHDEEFASEVEDDFNCLICQLPLKEPVLTRCGHKFCKECLEEYLRRQEVQAQSHTCPADRESLDRDRDIFPDKATERKILSLVIKCSSFGCDWTGELRNKEVHLASCPFEVVSCTRENCHVNLKRKDLEEHLSFVCKWRIIECEYCREPYPASFMQDHLVKCNQLPVACPNCGESVPRKKIPVHIESDCLLSLVSCPYVQIGCNEKVLRKNMESHVQSAMSRHLDLSSTKLINTQFQLNETQIKLINTQVQLSNTQVQLNETQVELINTQVQLKETQRIIKKLEEKVDTRKFIWKINEFSKIITRAKTGRNEKISSSSFYTECYGGYKLKVELYPDGIAYIAVHIVIMRGEYDAILPWPFNKKVMITLVDQQEDQLTREHITRSFIPRYNPRFFSRPTGEENSSFFVMSISHTQLETNYYLVNDTLFLKIEIL